MPWENTEKAIRSGHRSSQEFQPGSLKTIVLSEKEGIEAVVGKPLGKETTEIESYIYQKDKGWTLESAKEWFSQHYKAATEHVCAVLPFVIAEKILNKPLRIQGLAMTTGMSRNLNVYTPKELEAFAGKLVDAPVYLEHVSAQDAVGKVTKTQWDGANLLYEAEIYDEDTAQKIRNGLIRHVSVGADYQTLDEVNGKVPHGLFNPELSLVAVPGIAQTNIQILEKLRGAEQFQEPLIGGEYTLGFLQDAGAFLPEHFSTVWLDREDGVLAVMGKTKQNPDQQLTQAIYFSNEKLWEQNRIRDWLRLHPSYTMPISSQPQQANTTAFSESLIQKQQEPTIPVSEAVRLIEGVLPSHLVQKSWSLGPQRMCQELYRVLHKLRSLKDSHSVDRQ